MDRESENRLNVKEKIDEKNKKASEFMQNAENKISDTAEKATDQFEEYSETISEYIKNCPIKSVLTASAVGLVLGLLMRK